MLANVKSHACSGAAGGTAAALLADGWTSKESTMAGPERRPLIAGNWKMNGLMASGSELQAIIAASEPLVRKVDLLICPPATLVASLASRARGSAVAIGGQDCHPDPSGAHTGDISAEMLR